MIVWTLVYAAVLVPLAVRAVRAWTKTMSTDKEKTASDPSPQS